MPGLSSRAALAAMIAVVLFAPAAEWLTSANGFALVDGQLGGPPGQGFYVASRLFGMLAIALGMLQLTLSALRRGGLRVVARMDHRLLGLLTAALIIGHVAAFVTAASLRGGHFALGLLVPNLFDGAYNRGVSAGAIGVWLLLVGVATPLLRLRTAYLHRLAVAALALGLVHGLWIGSEKGYLWTLAALAGGALAAWWIARRLPRRA